MDVHVYFQTLESTHDQPELLEDAFKIGYASTYSQAAAVLERVKEIKATREIFIKNIFEYIFERSIRFSHCASAANPVYLFLFSPQDALSATEILIVMSIVIKSSATLSMIQSLVQI